jgi:non-specific serine/threonine protein kinase
LADALPADPLLLVLDGVEHLLAAGPFLSALLTAAPQLTLILTSRLRIELPGAVERIVPPLTLPPEETAPPLEALAAVPAVACLVQVVQALQPDFALTSQNAPAIIRIVRQLDGIPLALEIAAGHLPTTSPRLLADRLEQQLTSWLSLPARGADPVQRAPLSATLAWSYDRLDPPVQQVFRHMGVFTGGARADLLAAVLPDTFPLDQLPAALLVLQTHHLIQCVADPDGTPRYLLLEPLRAYARQALQHHGEEPAALVQYAAAYTALAAEARVALVTDQQGAWLERLEAEYSNLRATLAWTAATRRYADLAQLASELGRFWRMRNHIAEGRYWFERVVPYLTPLAPAVQLRTLIWTGYLAFCQQDYATAQIMYDSAVAQARRHGDRHQEAVALRELATVAMLQGDYAPASTRLEQALAISQTINDPLELAITCNCLALLNVWMRDDRRALDWAHTSRDYYQQAGDSQGIAAIQVVIAAACWYQGDYATAWANLAAALDVLAPLQDRTNLAEALEVAAFLVEAQEAFAAAVQLQSAASALRDPTIANTAPTRQEHLDRAAAALDRAAWDQAWTLGQTLTPTTAITLVEAYIPASAATCVT